MNTQARAVLDRLSAMGVPYELHEHAPIATAADRQLMGLTFDAQVCKNLLVSTRNGSRLLLLMLPVEKTADLVAVRAAFGTTRLGFAGQAALAELLGQQAGNVGTLGVIHDTARRVEVVFDAALRGLARVATHPGDNRLTVVTAFEHIESYVRLWGSKVHYFDF